MRYKNFDDIDLQIKFPFQTIVMNHANSEPANIMNCLIEVPFMNKPLFHSY